MSAISISTASACLRRRSQAARRRSDRPVVGQSADNSRPADQALRLFAGLPPHRFHLWPSLAKTAPAIGSTPSRRSMSATTPASTVSARALFRISTSPSTKCSAPSSSTSTTTLTYRRLDHGIKPLREFEEKDPHAHADHEKTIRSSPNMISPMATTSPLSLCDGPA